MDEELISIIMPAYNADQYITEAIQSVVDQTHLHWELLIINDGSKDTTEAKIKAFQDPRIRYFKQSNKGVSAARNVGLAHMRGDYFCFLDADDIFPPDSISSRLQIFQSDTSVAFVDGAISIKDRTLTKTLQIRKQCYIGNPFDALLHLDEKCFFGLSWMVKRKTGQRYFFKEGLTHGEDLLFYLSIAHKGIYRATNQIVLWYRTGNGSAMSNLQGLEQGYRTIYQELQTRHSLNSEQLSHFKQKIRSIVFKSYLSHWQPWQAIGSFYRMSIL